MDELQKLYDLLIREGKFSKSFDEFKVKWNDSEYKNKVYDVVSRDGFYSKDRDSFMQKYSGGAVATQDNAVATQGGTQRPPLKKKEPTNMDLPLGVSSSVSPTQDESNLNNFAPQVDGMPQVTITKEPTIVAEKTEEEDYFQGAFGNVLRKVDEIIPIGLGDFIDDMSRSVAAGYRQGTAAEEADKLLLQGTKPTLEQIEKFILANKQTQLIGPSDEFRDYQKTYEEEGKGFWGVIKGLAKNPSVMPELIVSSLTAMGTNTDALTAGGAAVGTGAAIGATGAGVGAVPGAIAAIPYAFGAASSIVEMGSTYGELLQEELNGKEMTKENVKAILEDPEKQNKIRNKAIARGIIIGTVDALTGKLASGVGAKILSKSAAKSAVGTATRGAVVKSTAAGAGVESLGGSLGEATARGAIGQEMDISEIALEGVTELPSGIRSTIQARFAKPSYEVNGEKVSAEQVDELIETMTPEELAKTKINIKNDYEGRQFKIQDKITTDAIRQQVKQANPELNEASLNAITDLEKELKNLEGNKTQTGKDKASEIKKRIKDIQENQLQEEVVVETDDVAKKRVERISALEEALKTPNKEKGTVTIGETLIPITEAENELNKLKQEENAIQEQSTDESVLRDEQPEVELPKVGEGDTESQVPTERTAEETLTEDEQKRKVDLEEALKNPNEEKGTVTIGETLVPIAEAEKELNAINEKIKPTEEVKDETKIIEDIFNEEFGITPVEETTPVVEETAPVVEEVAPTVEGELPATETIAPAEEEIFFLDEEIDVPEEETFTPEEKKKRASFASTNQKLIKNSLKSLRSVFPDLDVKFFDSKAAAKRYLKAGGYKQSTAEKVSGVALFTGAGTPYGIVMMNDKMQNTTLPHEIWHVLLSKAFKLNKNVKRFEAFRKSIEKTLLESGNAELLQRIKDHSDRKGYEKNEIDEEFIVELGAYLTISGFKIGELTTKQKSILNQIKDIINKFAMDVFNTPVFLADATPDNILSFLIEMSDSIRRGEDMSRFFEEGKAPISDVGGNRIRSEVAKSQLDDTNRSKAIKVARQMGMNDKGFFPKEANPSQLNNMLRQYGYSVAKAKTTADGFGGGLYLVDENGKKVKTEGVIAKRQVSDLDKAIKVVERARAQGVSEAKIKEFLESKDLSPDDIEAAMSPEVDAASRITLTEELLPGIESLMNRVDGLIETAKNNGLSKKEQLAEVLKKIDKISTYKNATDVQREKIIRDIQKKIGIRQKPAPSVDVLLGNVKDATKITMSERQLLIEQIKNKARGAKDAVVAWKKTSAELTNSISELVKSGVISSKQASVILKKFSKVNVFSAKSISRFVDYMTKTFADAEYSAQISTANELRSKIKKLSRDKDKNADLKVLGKSFSELDPALVEDIYEYNKVASEIRESLVGSKIKGENVSIAEMVSIDEASDYINTELKKQAKLIQEEKAAEIMDLMGIDVSDMTIDELNQIMEGDETVDKYKESIVRDIVSKAFDVYSNVIKEMLKTGYDAFYTGEKLSLSKSDIELIKKFMDMDLSVLTPKEGLRAVDALTNFIQNNSIANINTVLADYTGIVNAAKVKELGIVAQILQKFWSTTLGKALGEYTTNLNILFERMFKGFNRGGIVKDLMGLTNLVNQKAVAQSESNAIVNDYVSQFYKRTANGEAFNTEYNDVERGLGAFMLRSVMGTKAEMKEDFDRRKTLIEESIDALSKGDDSERNEAELYKKAYEKLVVGSENAKQVRSKIDKTNLEGIEFWQNQWSEKYNDLADVSSSVYNKILERDLNYTPDKFSKLSTETGVVDFDKFESSFHNNNGTLYKNETGVLMAAVKPKNLPKNPKNKDVVSYINLSFDKNNSNSMYDALIDMKTAAPIRQIEAFLNSADFKDIVPSSDAELLIDRIDLYIRNVRNKSIYTNDSLSNLIRKINKIATIGVSQALGGVTQPLKQMLPVAMNTLINAGSLQVSSVFDADKMEFMNKSGRSIANRGVESQAQIESINKLIEEASKSTAEKALNQIEKANRLWLDVFLVKPDVLIARASWMSYYEKSLKQQGIDTNNIDYKNHTINDEAADYAQRMVDRQQNVSDADLSGKLFVSKNEIIQIFLKTLMPFASFRMNQASRLGSDMAVLTDKTSTEEDKKIAAASLAGFGIEMATFKILSAGIAILLGSLTKWMMDKDEDEEEYKKRVKSVIKGQVTGTVTDIISPIPLADKAVQMLVKPGMDMIAEKTGLPLDIYGTSKADFISNLGTLGIAAQRANQLYNIAKISATGKYTDDYGKEHTISKEDQDFLKYMTGVSLLGNVGLAPSELNNVVNNAIKYSKQKTKSPEEKEATKKRLEEKQEQTLFKEEALQNIISNSTDEQIIEAANEKIDELYPDGEQKQELKEKRAEKNKRKKELLYDPTTGEEYDNESEMERYNPDLWNQNFGPDSDWYKENEGEIKLKKLLNKEVRKLEDEEYDYTPKSKSTRNSDGSLKRGMTKKGIK